MSMAAGQAQYGENFKTYDYFVVKHAVAAMDSRGDQGHFSDAFGTFHAALVLEFEMSLLAIDEAIGALPYWDAQNGDVFNAVYFGSSPGTGSGHVVTDGKFAHFPVSNHFNMSNWSSYLLPVNGASNRFSGTGGVLRGSSLATGFVTRFGTTWSYERSDHIACVITARCWSNWYDCIERSASFHSRAHSVIGGQIGAAIGDYKDPSTSFNDPLFIFHHAGIDRHRLEWMAAHMSEESVYFGYSGSSSSCAKSASSMSSCPTGGIELFDTISELWPFSSQHLGLTSIVSSGITHADVLCYLGPKTAPYTYAKPIFVTSSIGRGVTFRESISSLALAAFFFSMSLMNT